jgi:hypothetical protein
MRWRLSRFWPLVPYGLVFVWLLAAAFAYLGPALSRGGALGDYELLSVFGFGRTNGVPLHNLASSDQIQEMIPWTNLAWLQVHHGHLPLWNPYAGLGLPLAFNFQSAAFSLTTAVSYLFPLHLAYTVAVVARLVVAGGGVVFLCRVLGVPLLPAAFAGTIFELSGPFTAWSGWSHAGVYCWLGWIFGAIVLVVRERRPVRDTALLALFVGLAVLGGHPESVLISLLCAGVFALVLLLAISRGRSDLVRLGRRAGCLLGGVVGGFALAAPLWIPGAQVIAASSHSASKGYTSLPHTNLVSLGVSTFYGLPVLHHAYFGSLNYYVADSYVGFGALALAVVTLVCRWRRPEVAALAGVGLLCALIVYSGTVARILSTTAGTNLVLWDRALIPLALVIAVLAGVGLQALIDRVADHPARITFGGAAVVCCLVVVVLAIATAVSHVPDGSAGRSERFHSLIVPGIQVAAGLLAAGLLVMPRIARLHSASRDWQIPAAAVLIVACEVGFLLTAAPDLWSSSPTAFATTPAERAYQAAVGADRVGFLRCPSIGQQPDLGILAEANSAYGVQELAAYDPVVPKAWFQTYATAAGHPVELAVNNFCASITSAAMAREFGVTYILVPPGSPPPGGTELATLIDTVGVWRVPGSGIVTEGPASDRPGAIERVVPYRSDNAGQLAMSVDASSSEVLRVHISDLPGWKATVDSHPVAVKRWDRSMMEIAVGPGRHQVRFTYRPGAWILGLWIGLATIVVLFLALSEPWWRARLDAVRRRNSR